MPIEKWYPLFQYSEDLHPSQHPFCFDQAKLNLFGLMEPRIDTEGVAAAKDNPTAALIHKYMYLDMRRYLSCLPMDFIKWWVQEEKKGGPHAVVMYSKPNYNSMMAERAWEAQCRLLELSQVGNTVSLNFRRKG